MRPIPETTDVDIAFSSTKHMPKMANIPEEFSDHYNKWVKAITEWFFCGIHSHQLMAKKGVNKTKAIRAIQAILGSYEPKHEHKTAACAYLLSEWFSDFTPKSQEEMSKIFSDKMKKKD